MNRFDMEFYNGYIKSTLRLARKVKKVKSLEEAKQIAEEMEERAIRKLEEAVGYL
jgi:hypothetical protein